jgi:hypothetical protein
MKLYTEEQMLQAFNYGKSLEPFDCFDDLVNSLNPIELPTDKEIEETLGTAGGGLFAKGAKWMRDKIKGGEQ